MNTKLAEVCNGNAVTGFFQPKKLGISQGVCYCTEMAKSWTVYQESLFVQHGLEQPGCTWNQLFAAAKRAVYQESLFVQHGLKQPGCTWIDLLLR